MLETGKKDGAILYTYVRLILYSCYHIIAGKISWGSICCGMLLQSFHSFIFVGGQSCIAHSTRSFCFAGLIVVDWQLTTQWMHEHIILYHKLFDTFIACAYNYTVYSGKRFNFHGFLCYTLTHPPGPFYPGLYAVYSRSSECIAVLRIPT